MKQRPAYPTGNLTQPSDLVQSDTCQADFVRSITGQAWISGSYEFIQGPDSKRVYRGLGLLKAESETSAKQHDLFSYSHTYSMF